MKKALYFLFLFIPIFSSAQDTIFYNANGSIARSASEAVTCKISRRDPVDTARVQVKEYNMAGKMLSEAAYKPFKTRTLNGLSRRYYNEGMVKWEAFYKNGKLDGTVKSFWPEARPKRIDQYRNDTLLMGHCFARHGGDTTYFPFKTITSFPGGSEEFLKYLDNNLKYPKDARRSHIQGEVMISFLVDIDGSIKEVRVKQSLYPSLDKEAVRVIQSMPNWIPSTIDNDPIRSRTSLPIIFKQGEYSGISETQSEDEPEATEVRHYTRHYSKSGKHQSHKKKKTKSSKKKKSKKSKKKRRR